MKQFLLGTATTLFFGAVLFGAFKVFSNIHRFGNSTYTSVEECVLDKMRGQATILYSASIRYCKSIVREKPAYSDLPEGFTIDPKSPN